MLPRVREPEAMDTLAEVVDYDAMDHSEVNRAFVADLLTAGPGPGWILDLGTGTAQIPIELCRRDPKALVLAIDASWNMLRLAARNVALAGLEDRIRLQRADAKRLPYGAGWFGAVLCNGTLHHVAEPAEVLREAWRVLAPGGVVLVRDLLRPAGDATVRRLVDTYAAGANDHQRQMFDASFRASLILAEVRPMVAALGAPGDSVRPTGDRHWTWIARKS
jgi:ubiquinone/menaquinone biosynthesis C-methylase UbiE